MLMEGTLCSAHPPTGYLSEAEKAYAALIEEVLRKNSMLHVYTGGSAQVYTREGGLLTENNELLPETCIATTETESSSRQSGTG